MYAVADIFYGTFWRIEPDAKQEAEQLIRDAIEGNDDWDFDILMDELESNHGARVNYDGDGATIWFGVEIMSISQAENKFDEMALLRVMDLDKGVLRSDIKERMVKIMDGIPYKLREKLSNPKFGMAWSTV